MPQPLFIHSTRSMTYSPESSKDRISERDSSDDECDGMSFAQLPSSRLKSIQHSGAESQKSCIATLDQLLEMDERDKEKTAAWEAATLNANSAETDQAGSSAFSRESKEDATAKCYSQVWRRPHEYPTICIHPSPVKQKASRAQLLSYQDGSNG